MSSTKPQDEANIALNATPRPIPPTTLSSAMSLNAMMRRARMESVKNKSQNMLNLNHEIDDFLRQICVPGSIQEILASSADPELQDDGENNNDDDGNELANQQQQQRQ